MSNSYPSHDHIGTNKCASRTHSVVDERDDSYVLPCESSRGLCPTCWACVMLHLRKTVTNHNTIQFILRMSSQAYPAGTTTFNALLFLPSATKLRQGNVFKPVCHSVHGGVSVLVHAGIHNTHPLGQTPPRQTPLPPLGRHPHPRQTPPGRRLLQRTVRILLECILVLRFCCGMETH